jgi:hypothetical protein
VFISPEFVKRFEKSRVGSFRGQIEMMGNANIGNKWHDFLRSSRSGNFIASCREGFRVVLASEEPN